MERRKQILIITAKEKIPKKRSKKRHWISDETLLGVEERRKMKARGINSQVDEAIYRSQNAKVQRIMRRDKQNRIDEQCQKVEDNLVNNSTKDLYQGVKTSPVDSKHLQTPSSQKMEQSYAMEKMGAIDGENTVMNYTRKSTTSLPQVDWTNPEEEPPP